MVNVPPSSSAGAIEPLRARCGQLAGHPGDLAQRLAVGVEYRRHDERIVARDGDADIDAREQLKAPVAVGAVDARELAQRDRRRP